MKVSEFLNSLEVIHVLHDDLPVEQTAAEYIISGTSLAANIASSNCQGKRKILSLGTLSTAEAAERSIPINGVDEWMFIKSGSDQSLQLFVSHTWFLYRLACQVVEEWPDRELSEFSEGKFITCLLYTSPSPRDRTRSRMPSSA